jgi:hypothetical protein
VLGEIGADFRIARHDFLAERIEIFHMAVAPDGLCRRRPRWVTRLSDPMLIEATDDDRQTVDFRQNDGERWEGEFPADEP